MKKQVIRPNTLELQFNSHASCYSLEDGKYEIECKFGHRRNRHNTCVDIDECTEHPDQIDGNIHYTYESCKQYTKCSNFDGGYKCTCEPGFRPQNLDPIMNLTKACIDIDECGTNSCKLNTNCLNTIGSFQCRCQDGYRPKVLGYQNNRTESCYACRWGSVYKHFDTTDCSFCPPGTEAYDGDTECLECEAGYFSIGGEQRPAAASENDLTGICEPCPVGYESVYKRSTESLRGLYRDSTGTLRGLYGDSTVTLLRLYGDSTETLRCFQFLCIFWRST